MAVPEDTSRDLLGPDSSSNIGVCLAITRQRVTENPNWEEVIAIYTFQESIGCPLSIDSQTTLLAGDLNISIDLKLL